MLNKRVLYVARAGLPVDAAGIRISRVGELFEELGYDIHYICEKRMDHILLNQIQEKINKDDIEPWMNKDENHFKKGKKVYSYLKQFSGKKWDAVKDTVEIITANNEFRRLRDYCKKESPEIIILYNDVFMLTKKMIPYCRKHGIKLVADVTEWYEKRKNATIPEKILIYLTDLRIRKLDKHLDGVIAISPFFYDYYKKLNVNCLWIPPLMPIKDSVEVKKYYYSKERVINFVYAGTPGSKDILLPFLCAIQKCNKNRVRFRLDIVGISEEELRKIGFDEELQRIGIYVHGRKEHEKTVEIVSRADFGILFRYNKRYAKAGFSTKFAECMNLGVPMVCNRIGGTDSIIQSWVNGIVINSYDEEEMICVLGRIWQLPDKKILEMRKCAQQDANHLYDSKKYIQKLQNLLNNCVK